MSASSFRPEPRTVAPRFALAAVGVAAALLAWSAPAAANGAHLVKDVNTRGDGSDISSMNGSVTPIVGVEGKTFVVSRDGSGRLSLSVTDGNGTTGLATVGGDPDGIVLGAIGSGGRFFGAFDAANSDEPGSLWVSDGTLAGTEELGEYSWPAELTDVGGTVFFTVYGLYLGRSDGTPGGTYTFASGSPQHLVSFKGSLYFTSDGDLWKSDGTHDGTVRVKDMFGDMSGVSELVVVGDRLFFVASPSGTHRHDQQLWVSDGTAAGTHRVKDVDPTRDDIVRSLTVVGSTVFFVSRDATHGLELWKSDGTAAGTKMVKNINTSGASSPRDLLNLADRLSFTAGDGVHGRQLWTSDGSGAGTRAISSAVPTHWGIGTDQGAIGSKLFFSAEVGGQSELWSSDGTPAGTARVADINPAGSSFPRDFADVGGVAYFRADDGVHGRELWKSNGTTAGTNLAADLNPATLGSGPSGLTAVGDTVFFAADDGLHGSELWKSDGTGAGTRLVKDIRAGSESSLGGQVDAPWQAVSVPGHVLFVANDGVHGPRLWRSDGSAIGTTMDGAIGMRPISLTPFGGKALVVSEVVSGQPRSVLWLTDGTSAGTLKLKTVTGSDTLITDVTRVGAIAYFGVATMPYEGPSHWHLWKTDGTVAGTTRVWPVDRYLGDLTAVGSRLFFTTQDGQGVPQLWISNGTAAGTRMIKSVPGWSDWGITSLTNVSGTLFFQTGRYDAASDEMRPQLWKSDGTTAGTVRVIELLQAARIQDLAAAGSRLFFSAWDGASAYDLWTSNGTKAGTVCIKESVIPSLQEESPLLRAVAGKLYFAGDDGVNGLELWRSDGTIAGTVLAADVNPNGSSHPTDVARAGANVFFTADDGSHGSELWSMPLP